MSNPLQEPMNNKTVPYYDPKQIFNPLYQLHTDSQLAVKDKKQSSLKIREEDQNDDFAIVERTDQQIVEMKAIAKKIDAITAREELDQLIDKYREALESYSSAGIHSDFDKMTQNAHIFIMLNMRKDGANCQELEEFAEANVIHLRDEIKSEQISGKKLGFAVISGVLVIAGSLTGICGSAQGMKKLAGIGKGIGDAGSGTRTIGEYFDAKTQSQVSYLNSTQQLAQQKDGQFRDEKRRSDQSLEAARRAAQQVMEARHQTVLVFVRNNY